MKIIAAKLDLSGLDLAKLLALGGIEKESMALLPQAVLSFAELGSIPVVTAMRHLSPHIGHQQQLVENVLQYMKTAPVGEIRALHAYVKWKLRSYVVECLVAQGRCN